MHDTCIRAKTLLKYNYHTNSDGVKQCWDSWQIPLLTRLYKFDIFFFFILADFVSSKMYIIHYEERQTDG